MTAADLIFWYTGAGVWGIFAVILLVVVLLGFTAAAGWAYRTGRKIAIHKLCIAKIRDMDLTHVDVIRAFRTIHWPDNYGDILEKIAEVQKDLRDLTCDNWKRKDLLAKLPFQLAEDQREAIRQLFRASDLNDVIDYEERDKLVIDIVNIIAAPKKDNV
jgi:hypothetical protein